MKLPTPHPAAVYVHLSDEPHAHYGELGDGAVRIYRDERGRIVGVAIPRATGIDVDFGPPDFAPDGG